MTQNKINKSAKTSRIKAALKRNIPGDVKAQMYFGNEDKIIDWAASSSAEALAGTELMMRNSTIKTFYNRRQVLDWNNNNSFSKSPSKPKLLLQFMKKQGFAKHFEIRSCFKPFSREDIMTAHTKNYVDDVFDGVGSCSSNSVPWKPEFPETVQYTNASLYNAIRYANKHPEQVTFSPTSGFHHAHPDRGAGFCTFSGQVIASIKMYKLHKKSGAYIDLDGHFGNSIEDARNYFKKNYYTATADDKRLKANLDLVEKAIPSGFNINPQGVDKTYLDDLALHLAKLKKAVIDGKIHYIVFCHGADSHNMDDLGGQVNTSNWIKAAEMVYQMVNDIDAEMGRPVPFTMALFGGYRTDDYNSVLSLHTASITRALDMLCGTEIEYTPTVKEKSKNRYTGFQTDEDEVAPETETDDTLYSDWTVVVAPTKTDGIESVFIKEITEGSDGKQYFAGLISSQFKRNHNAARSIVNRLNTSYNYDVRETSAGLEICWNTKKNPRYYELVVRKLTTVTN